jgi:4-hydroxy-4-methyl-2-oxoglutarate aldolase
MSKETASGPTFAELAERFQSVQTAMVADALDELGHSNCTLPPDIRPLRRGMRVAGPAFPVRGRGSARPLDRVAARLKALEMLASVPAHHVAVFEANDGGGFSSHVGEVHATSLQARGAAGTITEGGCRDTEQVLRLGYPVFCRYNTPQGSLPRSEIVGWPQAITIGPVIIEPGDYIVGDSDGVVVVPAALRDKVLTKAEAVAASERNVLQEIRRGVHPLDAFRAG